MIIELFMKNVMFNRYINCIILVRHLLTKINFILCTLYF